MWGQIFETRALAQVASASTARRLQRKLEFLFSRNRLNVAVSRADRGRISVPPGLSLAAKRGLRCGARWLIVCASGVMRYQRKRFVVGTVRVYVTSSGSIKL